MDCTDLIEAVIDREGGFVSHPDDPGGATRWGITQAIARADGYAGAMPLLSRARAASIYRRAYWLRPGFDRVAERAPALAAELFDTGVNMGPAVAIAFVQRALNALNRGATDYPDIAADGAIGPQTPGGARRLPAPARAGWRNGAAERDRGVAGRTLSQPRRAPAGGGGVPLRLARKPHRLVFCPELCLNFGSGRTDQA